MASEERETDDRRHRPRDRRPRPLPPRRGTIPAPAPSPLALLLLGRDADPASERGVACPGELPAASDPTLVARARAAKAALGDRLFVLGHHYQRDEVVQFADVTGDSFKLAQQAAARPEAEFIVFCGVHFMAESADILTGPDQAVVLPDLAAGCSMADMATAEQVEQVWEMLADAGVADVTVPVSYMNSSAAIKAFTGRHGGTICTSSNAEARAGLGASTPSRAEKVLFLPDQHLGRNTAVRELGMSLDDCVVFDPRKPNGGLTVEQIRDARMLLWKGHCSVHGRFSLDSVRGRARPRSRTCACSCTRSAGTRWSRPPTRSARPNTSSSAIEAAPPGTRLGDRHRAQPGAAAGPAAPRADDRVPGPDRLLLLDDEPHRPPAPGVDARVAGRRATVVNRITVDARTAADARAALDQMLALP